MGFDDAAIAVEGCFFCSECQVQRFVSHIVRLLGGLTLSPLVTRG